MHWSRRYGPVVRLTQSITVTNGAIVIHTQRLKSDPGGNLLS
ncbi:nonribosomal peptide synthetase/polyketide synthase [Escherichia coli]|nr:nonribosomal peptide synthetase/polyketide synthase [Escherichia coli]EFN8835750.1 nonribosomal peptide synthetase/polyketide synthase [Escherichia coli]EFN8956866.1 nonribosomal peptide synthetase/polyketide synthase [Escherichia coli]EFN9477792.1 nonribosomal peptide synthetase/polyketide synthase [Escherichia coli]EFO0819796.1 nonribosomal peptide synthetase/polyketide synthase [Escherichia coli]